MSCWVILHSFPWDQASQESVSATLKIRNNIQSQAEILSRKDLIFSQMANFTDTAHLSWIQKTWQALELKLYPPTLCEVLQFTTQLSSRGWQMGQSPLVW
jgi:hypothetical protein